jgi:class 3 adenylate cyclase
MRDYSNDRQMERTPVTRRLAAIIIADVIGYTRLMDRDEAGTHARLREIRDNRWILAGPRLIWSEPW